MEKGQKVQVKIHDMSFEGQGIGRAEGVVIFVSGTVPGDLAEVEITKVKKNYCFAKLIEIIKPSSDRIEEFDCEALSKGCGGCIYGSLSYPAQLRLKENQVREKLRRLAGLDNPLIRPIIGMDSDDNDGAGEFRYRNKAQFPVSTGGIITRKGGIVENLGEPSVGFYKMKSHHVVDCPDCYIQSMPAMAAAQALRQFMAEDNITAWDPKWEKGLLRHLIVKTGFNTGEVMVILVINGKGIPNAQKLVGMLDDAIYEVGYSLECVAVNVNKAPKSNDILGDETTIIAGKPVITDTIGDLTFEISPTSFYQVNPVQVKRLYDKVHEYCDFDSYEEAPYIMDLYCGVGTIGLYCADEAAGVVGIEVVKDAVLNANRNAVVNSIVNARYICGKAEEILPQYIHGKGKSAMNEGQDATCAKNSEDSEIDSQLADMLRCSRIAIIDPPRAGSRPELLEAVAASNVDRIIYVSCDTATLGRDIKYLEELGFNFIEATPTDMFPWTAHIETIVLLSKLDSKNHISVELPMDDMDLTSAESKATYKRIQNYVLEKFEFKVSTLYIAQVKRKYGLDIREHYNISNNESQKIPQCPIEKEEAILDALKHFKMI